MQINAGRFRGRKLKMTNLDTTRETSDKVRQAIFNLIGQFFDGGIALDLFCGSGAMGLEAYSRGISKVYFNDINLEAANITKSNCIALGNLDDLLISNLDYKKFIEKLNNVSFDLIFLDPPYSITSVDELIYDIDKYNLLNKEGLISFEMHKDTNYSESINNIKVIKERIYGIKKVVIYKRSCY